MPKKQPRLRVRVTSSPLFSCLGIRRLALELDGEVVGDIWTHRELNQTIAAQAAAHHLDLLSREIRRILRKERKSGLLPHLAAFVVAIKAAKTPFINGATGQYKFCYRSATATEQASCHFDGPGLAKDRFFSLDQVILVMDQAIQNREIDLFVGIRLLQAAVKSALPLTPPQEFPSSSPVLDASDSATWSGVLPDPILPN